jgi:outer membrane protein assembly factor BamB
VLLAAASAALIAGCASEPKEDGEQANQPTQQSASPLVVADVGTELPGSEQNIGLISPNSFKVAWRLQIDTEERGLIDKLYLRDDTVFIYTQTQAVQSVSTSGRTKFVQQIVDSSDVLYPPILLPLLGRLDDQRGDGNVVVFPRSNGFVVTRPTGEIVAEPSFRSGLTTPAVEMAGLIYVGVADERGGRLVQVDPLARAGFIQERVQVDGSLAGRPAAFGGFVYVADLTGKVYGMTEQLSQLWNNRDYLTEEGKGVNAGLTVDDFGLYIAGTDGTLNVVNRESGRRLWRYFSGSPLFASPVVTDEYVYQARTTGGVVALSKFEGSSNSREPIWTAENAIGFLSHDDQNVYLLQDDGFIAAHDKETGDLMFKSETNNLRTFARNVDGPRIFGATRSGEIVAIDPVLGRGEVGELAMLD